MYKIDMTPIEAYEAMIDYYSTPGVVLAFNRDEATCMYRTPDGAKCAVGCLIPDNEYTPEMEGEGFGSYLVKDLKEKGYIDVDDKTLVFLKYAQAAHDNLAMSSYEPVEGTKFLKPLQDTFGRFVRENP